MNSPTYSLSFCHLQSAILGIVYGLRDGNFSRRVYDPRADSPLFSDAQCDSGPEEVLVSAGATGAASSLALPSSSPLPYDARVVVIVVIVVGRGCGLYQL